MAAAGGGGRREAQFEHSFTKHGSWKHALPASAASRDSARHCQPAYNEVRSDHDHDASCTPDKILAILHSGTDNQFHITCSPKQLLIPLQGMGTHCGIMPKTPFNTAHSCDSNNCAKGDDACHTWLHPICPGVDSQPPGGD